MHEFEVAHVSTVHRSTDTRIAMKECAALAASGIRTCLIAQDGPRPEVPGLTFIPLPRRAGRVRRLLWGGVDAWRSIGAVRPEMIHIHDPELIPLAIMCKLRFRIKAVYDAHEELPKQIAGKSYLPVAMRRPVALVGSILEFMADTFLDGIVAATPAIARHYRNDNVVLVQNYPWRSTFEAAYVPDVPSQGSVVYIGAITVERGVGEMVEAVATLDGTAHLKLAGPLSAEAEQVLSTRRDENIDYLGSLPVEDMPALLAGARIGMVLFHPVPNHIEAQPTKIYEYMAAGRPFIASNFEAWMDSFGPAECGLFVDPTDVEQIRRALQKLLVDDELAQAMGERGRAEFVTRFVFDTEAPRLLDQTRALLGAGRTTRQRAVMEGTAG